MAKTARITLVPISESLHLDGFHRIWSNADVAKWTGKRYPLKTVEESRSWMAGLLPKNNPDGLNYAVCLRGQTEGDNTSVPQDTEGEMIGVVGVHKTDPEPELGYVFAYEHWGRGHATEAVKAFIDEFWVARPKAASITAITDADNIASQNVLVKCGFRKLQNSWKEKKGEQKEISTYKIDRPSL